MNTQRSLTVISLAVILALFLEPRAHAAKFWKNSVTTGVWNAGNNWSAVSPAGVDNGGVPVMGEEVNLVNSDGAARIVTYNANAPNLGLLTINNTGAGTNTLSLPGNNTLTVGPLYVGGWTGGLLGSPTIGRGAVNQASGTVKPSSGQGIVLGYGAGSSGAYTLQGAGALNANNRSAYIGFNGTGTFNQSAGTTVTIPNNFLDVGRFSTATGAYNLSGGSLTAAEEYIGDEGVGRFVQTGGTNTVTGAAGLTLGWAGTGNGTYTISGGALTANSKIEVGRLGTGTMTIQNNGSVFTDNLTINSQSNVNLNGGTLRFNTATGLNRLNYTAGTIQLAGDRFVGGAGDPIVAALFGSTPTIPSGKSLTVEGQLFAPSLTVNGGRLDALSLLHVGFTLNASLTIDNGGVVTCVDGIAGSFEGNAFITIRGPGSAWHVTNNLGLDSGPGRGHITIENQGMLHVGNNLYLANGGSVTLRGGTLRVSTINGLNGVNFQFGTIQLSGGRTVGGPSTDPIVSHFFGSSPVIPVGKALAVEGSANLGGALTVDGGTFTAGSLAFGQNLLLRRGTFNLTNQALLVGSGGMLGDALDINDDATINVGLGIMNQGLVTGGGQIGGSFTNAAAGELRAESGRSLTLTGANNTNAGQVNLFGGQLEFTQNLTNNVGAFISGNGTLIARVGLANAGTMNFSGLANVVGDVTNATGGKIISSGGGPTTFFDDVVNQGEIRTSAGGFTVFFGSASGSGAFTGPGTVNFEGDLSPGSSAARVQLAGDVAFGPGATLNIELGGVAAGTQYDQISVTGDLALDGALALSLINGFTPIAGQTFNILDWGGLSGAFSSISLPTVPGLAWNTSQLYTTGVLSLSSGLSSDFDEDGDVDGADLARWRTNFGTGTTHLQGDADGDGDADGADFLAWQRQLGQGAPNNTLTASAPEPAVLALLATGLPFFVTRLRSRGIQDVLVA